MLLEIAVFNIGSAVAAAAAGADRIELCENPADGGTTPSYGTLKIAREKISIPVFPILRPRGGDFIYTDEEFEAIKKDLLLCKELQFEGVVTGSLNIDGTVNTEHLQQLVDIAYPMELTFHRAFDRTADPFATLETLIDCGCARILTSGQVPDAWSGRELIKQLVVQAGDRIVIMPGSGVRSNNISALAKYTGAKELHSSARKNISSSMSFVNMGMNEELINIGVDTDEVRGMKEQMAGNKPSHN